MKFNIWQFALLCIFGTIIVALGSVLLGSVWTGEAGDAYNTANDAYEGRFQMTPIPPLVYPADFTVCRQGTTEVIEVPNGLQWNYQILLAQEAAQRGELYFGTCR